MWTFERLKLNYSITTHLDVFFPPLNCSSSKVRWVQKDLYMILFYQNYLSNNPG